MRLAIWQPTAKTSQRQIACFALQSDMAWDYPDIKKRAKVILFER